MSVTCDHPANDAARATPAPRDKSQLGLTSMTQGRPFATLKSILA